MTSLIQYYQNPFWLSLHEKPCLCFIAFPIMNLIMLYFYSGMHSIFMYAFSSLNIILYTREIIKIFQSWILKNKNGKNSISISFWYYRESNFTILGIKEMRSLIKAEWTKRIHPFVILFCTFFPSAIYDWGLKRIWVYIDITFSET